MCCEAAVKTTTKGCQDEQSELGQTSQIRKYRNTDTDTATATDTTTDTAQIKLQLGTHVSGIICERYE